MLQYVLIVKISCEVPELGHVTPGTCSAQLPAVQCPASCLSPAPPPGHQAASRELLLYSQTRSSAHQKSLLLSEAWRACTAGQG